MKMVWRNPQAPEIGDMLPAPAGCASSLPEIRAVIGQMVTPEIVAVQTCRSM
jgi:hypothetical protein